MIHPINPQLNLIADAVHVLRQEGVIAYPNDSTYVLGCMLANKFGMERICQILALKAKHQLTLVCRDLSELAHYAIIDNPTFRLLKAHIPGPYTFILKALPGVPRRLQHTKRRTIGVQVPNNKIVQALLAELHEPLLSETLILPGNQHPLTDPVEIRERLTKQIDLIVDGGVSELTPSSSVVDLTAAVPAIVRVGQGDTNPFLE